MKQCKFCKSQIDEATTKCPVCNEWQAVWSSGGPGRRVLTAMILFGGLYYGLGTFIVSPAGPLLGRISGASFKLASVHKKILEGSIDVIGEENALQSSSSIQMPEIEVTFYDKENKIVDTAKTFLNSTFEKGEVVPFKVHFGGCSANKSRPMDNYDHFKVRIAGVEQPHDN